MTQYFGDRIRPTFVALSLIAFASTPLYWVKNPNPLDDDPYKDEGGWNIQREIAIPLLAL